MLNLNIFQGQRDLFFILLFLEVKKFYQRLMGIVLYRKFTLQWLIHVYC